MCLRCRISIRNNFGNKNGNSILKNFVENFSKPYFAQANVSRFSVMSVFVFRILRLEMCLRCRISIRNNFGNKNGNSILKNFVENFSKPYFAQANVSRFSVMSVFVFRNLWLEIRNRIGKLKWKYFVFLTVCRFTFTNSSYKKLLVWFLSENILLYLSFSYICNVQ